MDESATGNPVFDYRADFRRKADSWQWLIIKGGALLFVGVVVIEVVAQAEGSVDLPLVRSGVEFFRQNVAVVGAGIEGAGRVAG